MDFSQLRVEPVRFIPFDLGVPLSNKHKIQLRDYFHSRHSVKEVDDRTRAILSRMPLIATIDGTNGKLDVYLFDTGIGVFVLKDDGTNYKESYTFIVDFLKNRKKCHHSILEGKYPESLAIHKVTNELRDILAVPKKKIRKSGLPDWEYGGLSYIMSMFFCFPSKLGNEKLTYQDLPNYLQKGIPIILNPAYLGLNDPIYLENNSVYDQEKLVEILDDIDEKPQDYETRKNIMTFMSWASVCVIGNISNLDIYDWILLEIELQHYWYYLYCLEMTLPTDLATANKSDMSIEKILTLKMETQRTIEDVRHINGSSTPDRFHILLDGLIHTSKILINADRLLNKLSYLENTLKAKQEKHKNLLIQTTEFLIFLVAFLQIAPELYKYFANPIPLSVPALIKTVGLFVVMACVIIIRNRYR